MSKRRSTDESAAPDRPAVSSGIHRIRQRIANRSDPELLQGLARLLIVCAMVAFAYTQYLEERSLPHLLSQGRLAVVLALAASLALLLCILRNIGSPMARRVVGISHDTLIVSFGLYLGGDTTAWFAIIYLLIILGNGMRYGAPYLILSSAMSLLGFAAACRLSPYWQDHTYLAINIFAVLLVVPTYMLNLLRSLDKANASLEERARFDSLTGLINRHELELRLDETLTESPAGHALLFCDLDYFKTVNDKGGHGAGDAMLKDISRIFQRTARKGDHCARMGGDEFCVLITHCDGDKATAIADRIQQRVAAHRLLWGTREFSVGISIGVAFSTATSTPSTLLQQADAACYVAKGAGRNQISVFTASTANKDPKRTGSVVPIR